MAPVSARQSAACFFSIWCLLVSAFSVRRASAWGLGGGGGVEIRPARLPADLPQIRECRRTAFPPGANLLSASESFANADQAQKDGFVCLVARERSRVLGTADVDLRERVVNNVFVREDARGRGLGRKLMEGVEEMLERPAALTLLVDTQNAPAVGLYRSMGFETRGIHGAVAALSDVTSWSLRIKMTKKLE